MSRFENNTSRSTNEFNSTNDGSEPSAWEQVSQSLHNRTAHTPTESESTKVWGPVNHLEELAQIREPGQPLRLTTRKEVLAAAAEANRKLRQLTDVPVRPSANGLEI